MRPAAHIGKVVRLRVVLRVVDELLWRRRGAEKVHEVGQNVFARRSNRPRLGFACKLVVGHGFCAAVVV